ncbi:hypothetical protein [Hydrogenophaga electricum]|uniref:Uncharacterized protein n=1 Tax=Hydrogenophaga electricum TaxID=1230953 RepID=A0ABQ6C4K2_9BURK|nr:hypothetical protein [Hydrogenophaga electricum]GLS13660.1 hypothetical protein GCM10007935_10900 [Hydrogenophaga electricum]
MAFRTVSQILDAEFVEAIRLSPPPTVTAAKQPLAGQVAARAGGTNYLAWLAVRLHLENQRGAA